MAFETITSGLQLTLMFFLFFFKVAFFGRVYRIACTCCLIALSQKSQRFDRCERLFFWMCKHKYAFQGHQDWRKYASNPLEGAASRALAHLSLIKSEPLELCSLVCSGASRMGSNRGYVYPHGQKIPFSRSSILLRVNAPLNLFKGQHLSGHGVVSFSDSGNLH